MRDPVKFGDYYLFERIAVGGMAEVFKAVSYGVEGFERLFALKRVLPDISEDQEFIEMFIDEAKIAVQLSHANIGQIFELGNAEGSYFIAMEYLQGMDLRTIFDRARRSKQRLDIPMCCHVVKEVCEALEYAHNKRNERGESLNLVHRDVSPQNILISYDGEAKLIDFGIAKAAGKANKTQAGILKGKFGYMSPEQVRGKPIDRRSDLFSLAVVLYELLTLERCFQGESDFSTLEKVRAVDIRRPSSLNRDIPRDLEQILLKGLSRNPEERYQSAAEFQDALQRFLYQTGTFYARKELSAFMKQTFEKELKDEQRRMNEFRDYARMNIPEARRAASIERQAPESTLDEDGGFQPDLSNLSWDDEEVETAVFDRSPSQVLSAIQVETLPKQSTPGETPRKTGEARKTSRKEGPRTGQQAAIQSLPTIPKELDADKSGPATFGALQPGPQAKHQLRAGPSTFGGLQPNFQPVDVVLPPEALERRGASSRLIALLALLVVALSGAAFVVYRWGQAPESATLQLTEVDPGRVSVFVDGQLVHEGGAPVTVDGLAPGGHRLQVMAEGYAPLEQTLNLEPGDRRQLLVKLSPKSALGTIELETIPGGARAFIDDQFIDETPLGKHEIAAGKHRLRLEKTGYLPWVGSIDASGGQPLRIQPITLLPERVQITFVTEPDGGVVSLILANGEVQKLGPSPVSYNDLDNTGKIKVKVEHPGHQPFEKVLPQYRDRQVNEVLALEVATVAVAPTPGVTPRPGVNPIRGSRQPARVEKPDQPEGEDTPPETPLDVPDELKDDDCIGPGCAKEPPVKPVAVVETPKPVEAKTGFLKLQAKPPARAFIGGKDLGWTPLLNHALPTGTHSVTLIREEPPAYRRTITVLIEPGKETLLKVTP